MASCYDATSVIDPALLNEPYKEVSTLLVFLVVIGVSLYFVSSSDSGGAGQILLATS